MSFQPPYGQATTWPPPPPPPPTAAPRAPSRLRRGLVAALVVVLVAAIAAGAAFYFLFVRGSGDTLISMAPANSAMYAAVYFDPSGSQKLDANNLLSKFPKMGTVQERDKLINDTLDNALRDSGMSHNDIRPWLGNEIAFVAGADIFKDAFAAGQTTDCFNSISNGLDSGTTPPGCGSSDSSSFPSFAVLISSSSDSLAQGALAKSKAHSSYTDWRTETTDGIVVTFSNSDHLAYAVAHHTVILASSTIEADLVIKTADGKNANLSTDADYMATNAQLPGDRVGLFYMSMAALRTGLADAPTSSSLPLDQLSAYRGIGAAVSAAGDGVQIDATATYDPSKLTAEQKAMIGGGHANSALGFVPGNVYGFMTLTQIGQILQSVDQSLTSMFNWSGDQDPLQRFGLVGDGGIVSALGGDAGVWMAPDEATPGGSGAAFLFASSDDAAISAYLTDLPSKFGCGAACPQTTLDYKGTTITILRLGVERVGWTIYHHMVVIGTSPDVVEAAVDAQSGDNIGSTAQYKAVAGHLSGSSAMVLYVDVPAIAAKVRSVESPAGQNYYDQNIDPYLRHVGAAILSSTSASDHTSMRIFVAVN